MTASGCPTGPHAGCLGIRASAAALVLCCTYPRPQASENICICSVGSSSMSQSDSSNSGSSSPLSQRLPRLPLRSVSSYAVAKRFPTRYPACPAPELRATQAGLPAQETVVRQVVLSTLGESSAKLQRHQRRARSLWLAGNKAIQCTRQHRLLAGNLQPNVEAKDSFLAAQQAW